MSHNRRGGYRSSSRKNAILSIIIVLLAVLLGTLLWMNKKDEDKKSAELRGTQCTTVSGRTGESSGIKAEKG